jgi:hypothetical protein
MTQMAMTRIFSYLLYFLHLDFLGIIGIL